MQLTASFHKDEFLCRCGCGANDIAPELVNVLQNLHDELSEAYSPRKVRIVITSGVRCLAHNRSIGSNDTSQHVHGTAADIQASVHDSKGEWERIDPEEVAFRLEKYHPGGLGRYPTFTHVDVRTGKARW
jgi:uncharacterized protein YcbK (DUF882 family)